MNQVVKINENSSGALRADTVESVLIKGDLSALRPDERSAYYIKVCESVGLNPLTKPFEYLALNGKLVLYALRACTDQLRGIHNVSVLDLTEAERDGVFIVTAKVRNGEGRTDMAKGAVTIGGLKGDALANAIMKAETKAKRRATLSLCGLGFLDETELETIPAAAMGADAPKTTLPKKDARDAYARMQKEIQICPTREELRKWGDGNKERIAVLPPDWQDILRLQYQERLVDLQYHEKPQATFPTPQSDLPGFAKWLDTRLSGFKDPDAMTLYVSDTLIPMIDDAQLFPADREPLMGIINSHENRLAP